MRLTFRYLPLLSLGLLGACKTATPPPEVRYERIEVPVAAPCPDKTAYEKLKATRPMPLRESPVPKTKEERVAKTAAQLGRYEAEGGWADQVTAALDRCQVDAGP